MPKHYKEMMDEIINKIDEDAPANAVGTGANVALPPAVEPGVKKKKDNKRDPLMFAKPFKRKIKESDEVVAASDAFFPFVDGIETLIQAGVSAVIQPSGSIRDKEIIKYANETETVLIFSKTRHFKH